MLVIRITGKAKQVFKTIEMMARGQGDKTLGQIIKEQA